VDGLFGDKFSRPEYSVFHNASRLLERFQISLHLLISLFLELLKKEYGEKSVNLNNHLVQV